MHETILRIFFILFVASVFVASGYFRSKAAKAGDKLDRKKEGMLILVTRIAFGILLIFFLISYMVYPEWIYWSKIHLPVWLRYMGVLMALIISPLVFWMFISLGKNITDTVDTRNEHTLVTDGIYKYIRHPLYTLGSLFYFSLGFITDSWIFFILAILSFLVIGIIRTRKEEQELEKKFGQKYIEYRNKTGKYFPKIFP
jgi:protein-S-isoprenylcysteine O-methyltransferase Ste14